MKKVNEVNIENERLFLRKDFLGWNIIHPNKIDGKIVLKNLIAGGSWLKLGILIVVIIIFIGAAFEYSTAIRIANDYILSNQSITSNLNLSTKLIYP